MTGNSQLRIVFLVDFSSCFSYSLCGPCYLYTSDAADDLLCVGLGGRRIIKKKKKKKTKQQTQYIYIYYDADTPTFISLSPLLLTHLCYLA